MSDVTEPRSQADKRGAPLPHCGARGPREGRLQRGVAKRADSKLFLFKKKKVVRGSQWFFFFFFNSPSFLVSPPPSSFRKFFFFFFFSQSLTAGLIQLQCQSTFFPPLPHLNKFKAPPPPPAHQI